MLSSMQQVQWTQLCTGKLNEAGSMHDLLAGVD